MVKGIKYTNGKSFLATIIVGLTLLLGQTAFAAQPIKSNFTGITDYTSPVYETKKEFTGVIAEWSGTETSLPLVYIRTWSNNWSIWQPLLPDHDHQEDGEKEGENHSKEDVLINVGSSEKYQFKIVIPNNNLTIEDLKFTFINAPKAVGTGNKIVRKTLLLAGEQQGLLPISVISRDEWGANEKLNYLDVEEPQDDINLDNVSGSTNDKDENIEEADSGIAEVIEEENGHKLLWPLQYAEEIRYLVVHHTVSTVENNNISLEESKQMVRNIQYYHAVKRGWGDIGYNYLIDTQGRIFEGRKGGEKVIGGHSIPVNRTSIGIAMIGNYQANKPPKAALEALSTLLANKADLYNLDPLGKTIYKSKSYPVISGHRDTDSTLCPGQNLYANIPAVRFIVAQRMNGTNLNDFVAIDQDPLREIVELGADQIQTIEIRLKNNSNENWLPESTYLGFFELEAVKNSVTFPQAINRTRVGKLASSSAISPGEIATFRMQIQGGLESGFVPINLLPVINGVTKRTNMIFVPIFIKDPIFSFRLRGIDPNIELALDPAEEETVEFKIENTGNFTWNTNDFSQVRLGMDKPRDQESELISKQIGNGRIIALSNRVEPGEAATVVLPLKAPSNRGVYNETYRPVIEGVGWADGTPLNFTLDNKLREVVESNAGLFANLLDRMRSVKRISYSSIEAPKIDNGVDSKNVRINLSYFDLEGTKLEFNSGYKLYVDNKLKKMVRTFDGVTVQKRSDNRVDIKISGAIYTGNIIRFVPYNERIGIVTIVDYERRPGWNDSLNDNQFRGTIEARVDENKLKMINELKLGYYLRGLAEVSNGSDEDVIKTLMILARTYAVYYLDPNRNKFKDRPYDLDDSPDRTQKYLGYGFEKRSPNVARYLPDVQNQVVTYDGEVVITPYFSKSDGRTLSAKEKWGWDWAPHLQSVADTFCSSAGPGTMLGHGVGLSGCGAAGMAAAGRDYQEIIKYYYQGVNIEPR